MIYLDLTGLVLIVAIVLAVIILDAVEKRGKK